jgi:hypothetical protein
MRLAIATLIWVSTAGAQQLKFDLDRGGEAFRYSYSYKDDAGRQQLSFRAPSG